MRAHFIREAVEPHLVAHELIALVADDEGFRAVACGRPPDFHGHDVGAFAAVADGLADWCAGLQQPGVAERLDRAGRTGVDTAWAEGGEPIAGGRKPLREITQQRVEPYVLPLGAGIRPASRLVDPAVD